MEFKDFKIALQKQFDLMIGDDNRLFLTEVIKDELWETYLNSFPEGTNNIYKESREYDCNSCKQFIRPYGNIVSIKDNKLISIWDIPDLEAPFKEVAEGMSQFVKSAKIKDIFISEFQKLGVDKNRQLLENGDVIVWDHFYHKIPKRYIVRSGVSVQAFKADYRDSKNVFMRSMLELTIEAGKTILELIQQGSIYRGEEHKTNMISFISFKNIYDQLDDNEKDNWCWANSFNNPISRIRNTAIGTLLIDLSEGVDLDVAVTKFEKVMAPENYKRPNAIYTKRMVEDAQKKVIEFGLEDSLSRRYARFDDITINNILFVDHSAKKKLKNSVFDDLKDDISEDIKKFDKVEEVSIDDFISKILPSITSLEMMVENRHKGNFMSLIAPQDSDAPTMFKWNNNFSWAYNGDITDSIKQNVKKAGGNIEGVLRFSIQWNTGDYNNNDFDAHCHEPNGNLIFYPNKGQKHPSSGMLDVDIVAPLEGIPAVENITWIDKNRMQEGTYKFIVHNYSHNGGKDGFSAEIEYEGKIYSYEYQKELKQDEKVLVAEIIFSKKDGIKFIKSLDSSVSSKEIWNVKTHTFVKVTTCMYSPNYWDNQNKIGNKHYFFILDGCKNENSPRGFFNEFLNENLMKHKKVFEALGSKMRVEFSDEQLSGVGFSSTQKNSIVVRVSGSFTRIIKVIL